MSRKIRIFSLDRKKQYSYKTKKNVYFAKFFKSRKSSLAKISDNKVTAEKMFDFVQLSNSYRSIELHWFFVRFCSIRYVRYKSDQHLQTCMTDNLLDIRPPTEYDSVKYVINILPEQDDEHLFHCHM